MIRIHLITLFPEIFKEYLNSSIIGRAKENNLVEFYFYNPIDESDKKRVDDRPYSGGPGMVLRVEPFIRSYEKTLSFKGKRIVLFTTPSGEKLTTKKAMDISRYDDVVIFCGHYEGMDDRIREIARAESISIGDYILSGGEIPALAIIDSLLRFKDGVLGNDLSIEENRISSSKVYTRPEEFIYKGKSYLVPDVLLSGNHKNIEDWKKES